MDAYKASVDFVNSDTEAAAQIIGAVSYTHLNKQESY